jgi:mono/diheme cytochrome c family protein
MSGLRHIAAAGLALIVSACAADGGSQTSSPTLTMDGSNPTVERGQVLAARECSRCHALGAVGDSPNMAAPPFRVVRLRNTGLSLERRLADIARGGHYEMPPIQLQAGEVADLAAYLESMGPN